MGRYAKNDEGVLLDVRCPECGTALRETKWFDGEGNPVLECIVCDWQGSEPDEDTSGDPVPDKVREERLPENTYRVCCDNGRTFYYIPGTYTDDNRQENYERAVQDAYVLVSGQSWESNVYFKDKDGAWIHTATMTGSGA